jgi:uncharacterized RDD family membrane protein YckC
MDQSEGTGSEAPQTPPPAEPAPMTPAAPAPTTQWAPPPAPTQAGPAGFVYADVPNRAIAYILDAILIGIINVIAFAVLAGIGLSIVTGDLANGFEYNYVAGLILGLVGLLISAAYFIYTWTAMRGTLGMKVLGMQVGNAGDGKTLTLNQGIRRWAIIAAPSVIAQALNQLPAIGPLLGLAAFVWFLFLLYTTWKSPTKQGYHDIFANSMVVKATRTAG